MSQGPGIYDSRASTLNAPAANDARLRPRQADSGRTVAIGILGGLLSAVGYAVYQRLPDEQRDRIDTHLRALVTSRINELRSNLNV